MTTAEKKYLKAYEEFLKSRTMEVDDPFKEIPGCELLKRAVIVAGVSSRPLVVVTHPGNYVDLMGAGCARVGVPVVILYPCPCGMLSSPRCACTCTPRQVQDHVAKTTRKLPSLTLWIHVPIVPPSEQESHRKGRMGTTTSDIVRSIERGRKWEKPPIELNDMCSRLLRHAVQELGFSGDVQTWCLDVAADIARLEGAEHIQAPHLSEAIQYMRRLS